MAKPELFYCGGGKRGSEARDEKGTMGGHWGNIYL